MNIQDIDLPQTNITAKILFSDLNQANDFAKAYTRKTLMGHSISPQGEVSVYNLNEETMQWIDDYVDTLNKYQKFCTQDISDSEERR